LLPSGLKELSPWDFEDLRGEEEGVTEAQKEGKEEEVDLEEVVVTSLLLVRATDFLMISWRHFQEIDSEMTLTAE